MLNLVVWQLLIQLYYFSFLLELFNRFLNQVLAVVLQKIVVKVLDAFVADMTSLHFKNGRQLYLLVLARIPIFELLRNLHLQPFLQI